MKSVADGMSQPCNNGMELHKVSSLLRLLPPSRLRSLLCCLLTAALALPAGGRGHTLQAQATPSPLLVLSGGTVIDVTAWGHSANDIPDAVVDRKSVV